MQTKAILRSLVAASVAAALAACGEKSDDLEEIVAAQQEFIESQQVSTSGSSGPEAPVPTPAPETEAETFLIASPDQAYPWVTESETKFYYGLDKADVVVPEGAIMLDFTDDPVTAMLSALDGQTGEVTVVMPAGTFTMDRTFNLDMAEDGDFGGITKLTIMGQGIDQTILDYTGSVNAKDGFLISNGANIEIAHFSIINSNNNAIKVTKSDGVWMHHLGTIWPGEPDEDNGAYGLYPVECDNVIVEDSFSFGSADAGVYVGQSQDIVVRRNYAVQNVAGIEIENSQRADVYDNYAYANTAGILIFDLPIGNGRYGKGTRVFNNIALQNNTDNFAKVGDFSGGVHIAPPGSGIIVLATSEVEIFDNDIVGNESFAVAISSYFLAEQDFAAYADPNGLGAVLFDGWKPVPRAINIHDNNISETGGNPRGTLLEDPTLPIRDGFLGISGLMPSILYDGLGQNLAELGVTAGMGEHPFKADDMICATNNGASVGEVFDHTTNANALEIIGGVGFPAFTYDGSGESLFNCTLENLPAYSATFAGTSIGCGLDDTGESCTSATPVFTANQAALAEHIIDVPADSYPDVASADRATGFYYGLDQAEVVIPEGAIELTFADDPVSEFLAALDGKTGEVTVVMPEGVFTLDRTFSIDLGDDTDFGGITKLTIMGRGISKTILSYTGSVNAKDGFLISNATNIEIAHFSVEDSNNNAIKVTKSDGVWMHHLGTIWPGEPDAENGAYGLYPVESSNLLVEDTLTFGSADAGVYVGQSTDIVVRRNYAIQNVAGIEIENSMRADVYDNYAYKNTAGVLVFDLPIGNGIYGSGVRVFNNKSVANNTDNFAKVSDFSGGVHIAPPGSGLIVLATSNVEVFDNVFAGNESFAGAVSSYFLAESNFDAYADPMGLGAVLFDGWKPIPRAVNIHDNTVFFNAENPRGKLLEDPSLPIKKGFFFVNGEHADFLYDGLGQNLAALGVTAAMGENAFAAGDEICMQDNGSGDYVATNAYVFDPTGAMPADLTGATLPPFAMGSDLLNCSHDPLPAYTATINGVTVGCGADDTTSSACAVAE